MLFNKYEMVLLWDLPDGPNIFSLTNSVTVIACGITFWRITAFATIQFLRGTFKEKQTGKENIRSHVTSRNNNKKHKQ